MKLQHTIVAIVAWVTLNTFGATYNSAPKVDSIADLTNRVVSTATTTSTPYVEVARFSVNHPYWDEPRIARLDLTATNTLRAGCVEPTSTGSGRWIFDDCAKSEYVHATWLGMPAPAIIDVITTRQTGQQITGDSYTALQNATDLVYERGGGTVIIAPGMYRVSQSILTKPNVNYRGNAPINLVQFDNGVVTGLADSRTIIFGSFGGGTNAYLNANGLGFPVFLTDGPRYYTNMYSDSFVNFAGDTVRYYRGGNVIENIAIVPEYGWSWNGTNYPGSGWVINEVANCHFRNSAVYGALGPGIYVRGGLGFRMEGSMLSGNWNGGIFVTDTSDTLFRGNHIIANKGFGLGFFKANTHYLIDNELWNPTFDLIHFTGATTSVTNDNYVSSQLVYRTNFVADPVNDTITNAIGTVTGMPIMFGGTSLPGGLDTNTIYFIRSATDNTNGANYTLWTSSGGALGKNPSATKVDITSTGGTNTWWIRSPGEAAAVLWAKQIEELYVHGGRVDMIFDRGFVLDDVKRGTVNDTDFFDMGREQKLRGYSLPDGDDIIALDFRNVSGFNVVGSTFNGAKDFTSGSIGGLFPRDYIAISLAQASDIHLSGNIFDRLAIGVRLDATSAVTPPDIRSQNGFTSWELRAVDSSSYITKSDWRGILLSYSNHLAATVPTFATNVLDFSVAAKFQMSTNLPGNGQENIWSLSSSTNFASVGSRQPYSINFMQYFDNAQQRDMLYVRFTGATNTDYRDYYTWINEYRGKHIETVVQRDTSGTVRLYVDGILRTLTQNPVGASPPSTTQAMHAPYFGVGRFDIHSRSNWLYGLSYAHGTNWTYDNIAKGVPWAAPQTNLAVLWDFEDASMTAVWDKSGNSAHGYFYNSTNIVQFGQRPHQISITGSAVSKTGPQQYNVSSVDTETVQDIVGGMVTAGSNASVSYNDPANLLIIDGPSDEYMRDLIAGFAVAGANMTITHDDLANTLTFSSTGGGGATNGSAVLVDGTYASSVNITNSTEIDPTLSGTNLTFALLTTGVGAGSYTNPTITIDSKGRITAATNGSASVGGGAGTNVFVNNILMQPAKFTNNTSSDAGRVVWYTNAAGDILAYATNLPAGGSGSNTVVLVNGSTVTNPNFTNTDANVTLSVSASTNVVINMSTNPAFSTISVGTLIVSNNYQSSPLDGRSGGFGDYIRTVFDDVAVSMPVEPRLLLLAPIGGQSLATGSGGVTNSFSTTPRHPSYSLSWTQGVHYGEPGTGGVVISSSALTGVKDLFAEVVTGPTRSETPVVAAVDYWNTYWSNNLAGNRARVLAVAHGLGGAELNAIDEGTASFSNLVAHIQGAAALATASNWVLNVPVWYFVHGENDTFLDTPVENYRTNFITMYERMNSIAKAASGQTNDPVVVMTQTASRTYENQSNSWPANAQLLLNLSDSRIKVAVPTYIFPTVADGVHLTNIVSAWLGEYLSKAARHELFGLGWNPVIPTNISIVGTNVVIKYHVPKPPLTFDTTLVSNPGNYGYSLDGATIGTPTVSGNTVTIPFTAGTPTRVKYGWNGTLGAADGPTTGQRGNLRDSDTEVGSLTSSNLYNWGLIFNLPTTVPSTPTGLAATSGNGKITLTWSRMDDTAYYVLKRSLASGGPYTTIKITNGISYEDADVAPSTTYYYVVVGHGPSGDSAQSAEVVGTASGGASLTRNWVPTDLGSKLVAWYRASSLSSGDGNPIDTWTDESGNGYHLTASSTVRPTQQTVSSRKVVRFDGTDDRMDQTSLGTRFNTIGEANFWTVGKPNQTNVTAGNRNLWYMSRATNGSVRLAFMQSATTVGRFRYGGTRVDADSTDLDDSTGSFDTNTTAILHTKFDFTNADKYFYTNGVLDHSDTTFASAGNTAAENLSLFRVGASALAAGGNPTNWFAGDVEMQIITVGVLSTEEREKMEGYIAHALGITNLLSVSHTYKTNAPTITTGGSGTSVFVNGSSINNPNFIASADITNVVSSTTNIAPTLFTQTGLSAGSYTNATVTVNSKGIVTAIATGSGGGTTNYYTITNNFVISTNNLGYLERNATLTTIDETDGEVSPWTITIPANTLGVDGDEVKIHMSGSMTIYTTVGGENGYSWRLISDSSTSPDTAAQLTTTNRYFSASDSEARSLDWDIVIKRMSTNTLFITTRHTVGTDNSTIGIQVPATNSVAMTFYRSTTLGVNPNTDPIDFTFYADVADDTRAATINLYGYLVYKVGSGSGGTNFISAVSSDFQVSAGTLSLTNTTGSDAVMRATSPTFGTSLLGGTDAFIQLDEHASAPSTPASGNVRVYAKADGKVYRKDDAGNEAELGGSASSFSTNVTHESLSLMKYETDFLTGGTGDIELSIGNSSGSVVAGNGETNRPGVMTFSTATSASGAAYAVSSSTAFALGGGEASAEWILNVDGPLADGTETYSVRAGFVDSTSGDGTDGVFFRYSTNSLNWIAVVREASAEQTSDTGLVASTNTWSRLTVVVNADASTAYFYTNGVLATSITHANVPSGTAYTRPGFHIAKTVGTTARTARLDYARFWKVISR